MIEREAYPCPRCSNVNLTKKFALRKKADSNVIATVANRILADANYEEAEKK